MIERWLPVHGYEGLYEVSDQGRVRRINPPKCVRSNGTGALIPNKVKKYLSVALWGKTGNKAKRCNIHRLVAAAFLGPSKLEVNHFDGDHRNNKLTNLEYVTRAQNWKHAVAIGRSTKGERNAIAKLTEVQVRKIKRLGGTYSHSQLGQRFGVSGSNIQSILAGKTWAHVVLP